MDLLAASFPMMCIATSSFGFGGGQSAFNVVGFGAVGDGQTDDSPAFLKAWTAFCGPTGDTPTLEIPSGKTFLLQPTTFRGLCKSTSVHVQVAGNIVAPNSTTSSKDCNSECWLCTYDVEGLSIDGSGTIDGRGSIWWSQGGQGCKRPRVKRCWWLRALYFHNCNNFQMNGITLIISPKNHITINGCNGVSVANIHIDSPEDSPNTDGIDISASIHVNIQDSSIKSGDDCIAVNGACSFVNVTGVACGPGHGISVGSLGDGGADDKVEEAHVPNSNFTGTQNGARIKTFPGGSGYARKISFEQITLIASRNPIIIDQHYCNGQSGCQGTSGVNVSEVTYSNVRGTSADEQAITLDCSENGCFNIKMDRVNITSTVPGKQTTALCKNAHGTSTSTAPQVPCLSG